MRSLILSILFVATLGIAIPEYSQAQTLNSDKLSAQNNNQSLKKFWAMPLENIRMIVKSSKTNC